VVLPSEKMPLAVNACDWPVAIDAVAGVTTMEVSNAEVTVAIAEPDLAPIVAVMVELPAATPVTNPDESTVANEVLAELHVAWLVTSLEVPSLYTPMADSCLLCPDAIVNANGETVIDTSEGAFTTTFPVPSTPPKYADTVTEPALIAVRRPWPFTTATVASEEYHVTWVVTDWVELSEYTPVAVSCSVPPAASDGEGVPTLIDCRTAVVTVTLDVPVTEFIAAVTVTVPAFSAVSIPELLTVAIVESELCHVTWLVIAWVLLSEYVPCAVSCSLEPAASEEPPEIEMDERIAPLIVTVILPFTEP